MSGLHASLTTRPNGYGESLTVIDYLVKGEHDALTVALLLRRNKNKSVSEYAVGDKNRPMGTTEYKLLKSLPADLQNSTPSIEPESAGDGTFMEDEPQ